MPETSILDRMPKTGRMSNMISEYLSDRLPDEMSEKKSENVSDVR